MEIARLYVSTDFRRNMDKYYKYNGNRTQQEKLQISNFFILKKMLKMNNVIYI